MPEQLPAAAMNAYEREMLLVKGLLPTETSRLFSEATKAITNVHRDLGDKDLHIRTQYLLGMKLRLRELTVDLLKLGQQKTAEMDHRDLLGYRESIRSVESDADEILRNLKKAREADGFCREESFKALRRLHVPRK